jgi:hypothetical protein
MAMQSGLKTDAMDHWAFLEKCPLVIFLAFV